MNVRSPIDSPDRPAHRPLIDPEASADYRRVATAIRYIAAHREYQPELGEIARHIGLSKHHFQRLFVRWAGVSPKQFLAYLTVEHAKGMLRASHSVLETALDVGLSGPGRLHDLFVGYEAMTPGDYKRQGAGLTIDYGIHPTPFGEALILMTAKGVCGLRFIDPGGRPAGLAAAQGEWPLSRLRESQAMTAVTLERILDPAAHKPPAVLRGTRFQIQVWRALLALAPGNLCSYGDLADTLGAPKAQRAVARAIGRNPVALLVPCHRVLRANGAVTGYRWGRERKLALIGWEAAQSAESA